MNDISGLPKGPNPTGPLPSGPMPEDYEHPPLTKEVVSIDQMESFDYMGYQGTDTMTAAAMTLLQFGPKTYYEASIQFPELLPPIPRDYPDRSLTDRPNKSSSNRIFPNRPSNGSRKAAFRLKLKKNSMKPSYRASRSKIRNWPNSQKRSRMKCPTPSAKERAFLLPGQSFPPHLSIGSLSLSNLMAPTNRLKLRCPIIPPLIRH